jgi:uncharacterized protein YlxW (UPF0749 family)
LLVVTCVLHLGLLPAWLLTLHERGTLYFGLYWPCVSLILICCLLVLLCECLQAKAAAEEARKEAEARLATLKEEYEQLQAEVKKAQEAAEQLAAAAQQQKDAAAAAPQQNKDPRGKKAKKQKGAKGFGKVDAAGKGATELTTGKTGDDLELDEMTGGCNT